MTAALPWSQRRRRRASRRGTAILMAIVCLSVVALLAVALFKVAIELRRVQATNVYRLQADWLAESALERAVTRLSREAGYQGETWKLTAGDLALPAGDTPDRPVATVEIVVEPLAGQARQRRVRTQATFPLDDPHAVQSVREIGPLEIPSRSPRS